LNAQYYRASIAVNGKVEIHPMMYVALSYDHRIIDGRVCFLGSCERSFRKPNGIIMDNNPKKKR
jgi:2-oxoglutarate dehydrogenase E2 component (dihydrolipoamide succinyltransferase)